MVIHVPQARRSCRWLASPAIGQALIWASVMIGSSLLLKGAPAEDNLLLILLAGATGSVLLTSAAGRCARSQDVGDDATGG